ncbi:chemotaxis protein CheW [Piscinibacter sp. HJYY11]|uniref:chemotaxis protein CheW n=1 Tax=Piscinibacter sp. HJYY11 TaxID=2801333 RepID=UPI00191E51F7|nr:chemotaxis protein CheW [Piscinibacter sp. HJYY11]MBL0730589.1 chemotaxis protein CheW [Piscinibacter sp. HJYY11]
MDMIQEGLQVARQVAATRPATAASAEYLSFRLGAEEYGIDLLKVQEIRSYEAPTRIANAPRFVKGVLNLRGVIMPVVDPRMTLDCERADVDDFTVVIVLNVCDRLVGVVVDSVSDVLALGPADIRPAPEMAVNSETRFINGIASVQERTLILLDIESLMAGPSMGLVGVQADAGLA